VENARSGRSGAAFRSQVFPAPQPRPAGILSAQGRLINADEPPVGRPAFLTRATFGPIVESKFMSSERTARRPAHGGAGGVVLHPCWGPHQQGEDMRPTMRLIALASLTALVLAGAAQAGGPFRVVLPENGMTVVLEENHSSPVVNLRFYVKAGSIYEGEYRGCGISHFLEHLVANGATQSRTAEEYEIEIENIGGGSNAYTTKDHTCYFIETSSETLTSPRKSSTRRRASSSARSTWVTTNREGASTTYSAR